MTFSPEQLNFFKFSTVVLDEFPVALRGVFTYMWDTLVASPPGVPKWDDSVTVLNLLHAKEGGVKKVPTLNKSYKEWDCTALFKATLYAQTFAMPDGTGGVSTLDKLYVRPRGLSAGTFHPISFVVSPTRNLAETHALALDQLRLLRNALCHQKSTQKIDKATFDNYISLAKDAFTALGQDSTRIDEIGKMAEDDFPTARLQQLKDDLKREKDAATKFQQIDDHLTKIESQVEVVGLDMKDVKSEGADTNIRVKNIESDVKELKDNFAGIEAASSTGKWVPKSGIPNAIPHFVGRKKECQEILDHLSHGETRLVDVWGPPGFGKTSVATNVAHELWKMEVPVYFASLRGMKRKDELVSKLLGIFADAKKAFYISPSQWLIQNLQRMENPFVLILDNADDLLETGDADLKEEVLRFIEEILTQCNHIKLLPTTRESLDYLSHKFPIHLVRVGVVDEGSSADLVKLLLPDVSKTDLLSIVQLCGQVPLAMRLMCIVVKEEHISVSELLDVLKTSPLFEVLDDDSFSNDDRLKVIIDTCFVRLAKQDRDAFVSLGVFRGSFRIDDAKSVLNLKTDHQTKKRLRSLKQKSLIECSDDCESYTMHSLFRCYIEGKSKTDQETEAVFSKAKHFYNLYSFEEANERFLTGQSTKACADFFDDRESIISTLLNGVQDDEVYVKVAKVLPKAELLLFTALNDEELLFNSIYDAVVEEATKRRIVVDKQMLLAAKSFAHCAWLSPDHQTWDISLEEGFTNDAGCSAKLECYYGVYQIQCGKMEESVSLLKSSVDRLTSSSDEKALRRLVYSVLADCHQRNGELDMASHYKKLCSSEPTTTSTCQEDVYQTVIMILAKDGIFGMLAQHLSCLVKHLKEGSPVDYPRQFKSTVDFFAIWGRFQDGNGHLDLSNMIKECAQLLKHSDQRNQPLSALLHGFLSAFGIDKAEHLVSSEICDQLLSSSLDTMEKYNFTKRLLEVNVCLYQSLTNDGQRVMDNASTRYFLSGPFVYRLQRTMFENALKSYEAVPGADFHDLARSYDKLGALLLLMEDYSGAEESFKRALQLKEEHNGDPVEMASTLVNLGRVYFKMNNEAEAEKAFEIALDLRKRLGVYDHVDTADIYATLGESHLSRENVAKALEAYQEALRRRKRHLGEHSVTAQSFNQVGHVFFMMGDYKSAKEAFHEAMEMSTKFPGEESNTAFYCHNLAIACFTYPDLVSARRFCQEALAMRQALGEHKATAVCLNTLGRIYFMMGEFPAAINTFQKASKLAKETLGDHTCTAESFFLTGAIHHELDDHKSAVEAFQEASRIRSKRLGDHKDTALSYHNLGVSQYNMGDLNGALASLQEASRIFKDVLGDHPNTAQCVKLLKRAYEAVSEKELECD